MRSLTTVAVEVTYVESSLDYQKGFRRVKGSITEAEKSPSSADMCRNVYGSVHSYGSVLVRAAKYLRTITIRKR